MAKREWTDDIDDLLSGMIYAISLYGKTNARILADAKEESRHDVEEAIATKGGNEVEVE